MVEVFNLFSNCQDYKCLPYRGGYLDQGAKMMECFQVIKNCMADKQRIEREAAERNRRLEAIKSGR